MPRFPKTVYVRFSESGDYLIVDEDPAMDFDPGQAATVAVYELKNTAKVTWRKDVTLTPQKRK